MLKLYFIDSIFINLLNKIKKDNLILINSMNNTKSSTFSRNAKNTLYQTSNN